MRSSGCCDRAVEGFFLTARSVARWHGVPAAVGCGEVAAGDIGREHLVEGFHAFAGCAEIFFVVVPKGGEFADPRFVVIPEKARGTECLVAAETEYAQDVMGKSG